MKIITINELTIILVSGAFLKCFSIYETFFKECEQIERKEGVLEFRLRPGGLTV